MEKTSRFRVTSEGNIVRPNQSVVYKNDIDWKFFEGDNSEKVALIAEAQSNRAAFNSSAAGRRRAARRDAMFAEQNARRK